MKTIEQLKNEKKELTEEAIRIQKIIEDEKVCSIRSDFYSRRLTSVLLNLMRINKKIQSGV